MNDILTRNRIILCHFDTYSASLLFARYGTSVLAPSPLPEGASAASPADNADGSFEPAKALEALTAQYGLDAKELTLVDGFQQWATAADGPIRIHLFRFTCFEAPKQAMEPHGAVFTPISQMRGTAPIELNMLRPAFNLFMGS